MLQFHIQTLLLCLHENHAEASQIPFWKPGAHHTHKKCYIYSTGGHSYKKRGCILGHFAHFPPCTVSAGSTRRRKKKKKSIHPCNRTRQKNKNKKQKHVTNRVNKTPLKKQRDEQNCGLGLKLWERGGKLTVFQLQLNCSYLHHNVKGVLVEQEHKKQTEKLFSIS